MKARPGLPAILAGAMAAMCGGTLAGAETFAPDFEAAPHDYYLGTPTDRFTGLMAALGTPKFPLDRGSELAFLRSLLGALGIPASSQLLVFSNTSLQLSLIGPSNPRALYFSDDLYLGYVPGGRIEVASVDSQRGAVFHIFDIPRGDAPLRIERARRCMNCHANEDAGHVPGLVIRSVAPGPDGGSLDTFRPGRSGHDVPLSERLGGWYVTGSQGHEAHWGNRMGRLAAGELSATPLVPGQRFAWDRYPVATSDFLAHLIHEHQVGFVNRMVRAQYLLRSYRHSDGGVPTPSHAAAIDAEARGIVRYLLFADEVPLPAGGIAGDPVFRREFGSNRRMVDGESLKDLDLKTRLFRNRCSYMVHTPLFAGMGPELKRRLQAGLGEALGPGGAGGFGHIPDDEKARIRKILRGTMDDLPAGW